MSQNSALKDNVTTERQTCSRACLVPVTLQTHRDRFVQCLVYEWRPGLSAYHKYYRLCLTLRIKRLVDKCTIWLFVS
jgi:ribosomal protein S27AE